MNQQTRNVASGIKPLAVYGMGLLMGVAVVGVVVFMAVYISNIVLPPRIYTKENLSLTESRALASCLGIALPESTVFEIATIERGQDIIVTACASMARDQADYVLSNLSIVTPTPTDYSGILLSSAVAWVSKVSDIESVVAISDGVQVTFCRNGNDGVIMYVEAYSWLDANVECAARVFARMDDIEIERHPGWFGRG